MPKPSKYKSDPEFLHQVELLAKGETTKENAVRDLWYRSVAVLNTILHRTGFNELIHTRRKELPQENRGHLFKSSLTPEQGDAVNNAVKMAVGVRRGGKTSKRSIWEAHLGGVISYAYFTMLVSQVEENQPPPTTPQPLAWALPPKRHQSQRQSQATRKNPLWSI